MPPAIELEVSGVSFDLTCANAEDSIDRPTRHELDANSKPAKRAAAIKAESSMQTITHRRRAQLPGSNLRTGEEKARSLNSGSSTLEDLTICCESRLTDDGRRSAKFRRDVERDHVANIVHVRELERWWEELKEKDSLSEYFSVYHSVMSH